MISVGRDSHTNSLPARRLCALTLPLPSVEPKSSRWWRTICRLPVGHDAVVRVRAPHLVVIQPGGEDRQAAQLAAVFVRDDVVGIVGARAVITERPERPAGDVAAGEHAVAAVGLPCHARDNLDEVAKRQRPRPAIFVLHGGVRRHPQVFQAEGGQVVLGDVVAEGVEELRGDQLGTARHLGEAFRVELDPVDLSGGVANGESWRDALALARDHGPRARRRAVRRVRALDERLEIKRPCARAGPVGEPARIGHLVDRVDVAGADVGMLARAEKRVLDQIVLITDLEGLNLRSVLRLGVFRKGIVRIEARRSSPANRHRRPHRQTAGQADYQLRQVRAEGTC